MNNLTRKSFIKNLGLLGAGGILGPFAAQANQSNKHFSYKNSHALKERVLRVAHLTDIHVKPEKIAEHGFASALRQVNNLDDKPDFIINGGDAIMNAVSFSKEQVRNQWNSFHTILRLENTLPVYHCIGNHDLYGWAIPGSNKEQGKSWAMNEYELSRSYYSFAQKGWKFIVLDSIHARKTVPGYFGKLDEEQMIWLKQELETTPKETPVCIVSHIPILAICTLFDDGYVNHNHWFVPDNTLHADASLLRDLFYRHGNVKACLSGHIHLIDYVDYLGTGYYCNGAVSGGWWKGDHQQFSPSFIIMNFYADGTTEREIHYYQWRETV